MSARRSSIIYDACVRFDSLKAIGVSRWAEQQRLRAEARARGLSPPLHAFSTGRCHADKTLETYRGMALRYVHWGRDHYGFSHLADLDARAAEMVSAYLTARLVAGDSPSTLKTLRSALRMFHRPAYPQAGREERVAMLGADIPLPRRRREAITRSRGPVAMDGEIALARYGTLILFCLATGLRRREVAAATAGALWESDAGDLVIAIANGKGGKQRVAPVLPTYAAAVRTMTGDRDPGERLFARIPVRLDVHSYRRAYAQALYCEDGRRPLPPAEGRLPHGSVDWTRVLYVSQALGHNRADVTVRHYLR